MSLKKLIDLDLLDRFLDKVKALIPSVATNAPQMDGTAAVGSSTKYAKEDHVHPTDASLVSLDRTGTELVNGTNLATITSPGNYYFTGTGTITNAPITTAFKMEVIRTVSGDYNNVCQIIFSFNGTANSSQNIYYRYYASNLGTTKWSNWQSISNAATVNNHRVLSDVPTDAYFKNILARSSRESISTGTDLNDIKTVGVYRSTSIVTNSPLSNPNYDFTLFVVEGYSHAHGCFQILFPADGDVDAIYTSDVYFRRYSPDATEPGWSDWVNIRNPELVNSHTVESDVPANAVFTDTTYTPASAAPGNVASSSSTGTSTNYARQDHTHGIDLATGDSNGQVKIAGQNVSVKGLGSLAYADSVTTVNGHTVYSDIPTNAFLKNLLEIGSSTAIPDGSNLNDYKTAGRYHTSNASHGISNVPSSLTGPFSLVVADNFTSGANSCHQFLFCDPPNNGRDTFFVRSYNFGTWGDWFDIRDAATVNGHTVQSDVPANAVFTDTTYTPASADPLIDGTAAVGTSAKYAREDHVHPKDTSLFSLSMDGTEIPSGADLNSYTTPGNYYCRSVSIASTLLNCPIVTEFKMIVMRNKRTIDDACTQIIFPSIVFSSVVSATSGGIESGIFYRIYNPYVWCNWIGVNNRYILTSNDDIDNCINPGIYHCQSNSYANTILNGPTTNKVFSVLVMEGVSGRTCQIGFVAPTGSIYFRFHSGATWTTWFDIRNPSTINGHTVLSDVPANLAVNGLYYGECDTAAATAAKVVTLTNGDGFSLVEGAKICVRFENSNSASNPTLNVNDTGAIAAVRYGTTVIGTSAGSAGAWSAGGIVIFVYDGTSWVEHYWGNTTYSSMSVAEYTAGTGTTARLMTPARLKAAIKMHSAPDVYTATIPTTGWTTESYGAYIDVTFTGATFAADDTVFVDLNLSDDANLQLINDSWACLLRATPTASSAVIRFKFREIPTVAIPVRAVVT